MIPVSNLFESSNIELIPLDRKFHKTIDIPNKEYDIAVRFDTPHSDWYTVLYDQKRAASTGIILRGSKQNIKHFFQIAIHQKYRRKGLVDVISTTLLKKYPQAKGLYAVINKNNMNSIKAHKKANFKQVDIDKHITKTKQSPNSYLFYKTRLNNIH